MKVKEKPRKYALRVEPDPGDTKTNFGNVQGAQWSVEARSTANCVFHTNLIDPVDKFITQDVEKMEEIYFTIERSHY
ncbi:MAG: hypothetical protein ABL885_13060 [Methylophilaceae bacterium]